MHREVLNGPALIVQVILTYCYQLAAIKCQYATEIPARTTDLPTPDDDSKK